MLGCLAPTAMTPETARRGCRSGCGRKHRCFRCYVQSHRKATLTQNDEVSVPPQLFNCRSLALVNHYKEGLGLGSVPKH